MQAKPHYSTSPLEYMVLNEIYVAFYLFSKINAL